MIIYEIKIPKEQDSEAFVKFMREEYFPAVHKGPTRAGQVTSLTLMQRQNETNAIGVENEFWWHVGWDGFPTVIVSMDDNEVERKFEAF